MLNLWTAAWHDFPAASLEDDDDVLADLAMCAPEEWSKVREAALRGWVKCSDGRLYHAVVAEQATTAWANRQNYRDRLSKARAAKAQKSTQANDSPVTSPIIEPVIEPVTVLKGQGQGERQGEGDKESPSLRSGQTRKPSGASGTRLPDAWNPGAEGAKFAKDLGLHPETTFARFGDYWRAQPGTKGRKTDWPATWRNWCRKESDDRGTAPRQPGNREPIGVSGALF